MEGGEQHPSENLIRVSLKRNWTFYTFLAKKLLHDHEVVELHALDTAIANAVEAAECLIHNGYATLEKMHTDSVEMKRNHGGTIAKAKIFIHLKRTKDFQAIYDSYEKERNERLQSQGIEQEA
ncbi:unnamed protein product [Moneuplotes crassus]|uniref:DNA/RNA-binding protein Alba-like domain-containing protein n=1 Tax=Euplotes crassus TaxID=5936 RepID=A0AAD1Y238_EUPCR|nr:unnamed protein product [Moneuplotes crassus]